MTNESELIGFVADITKRWNDFQKSQQLENASLHICPDQTWISVEHEQLDKDLAPMGVLIRKSPACHQIIVKI